MPTSSLPPILDTDGVSKLDPNAVADRLKDKRVALYFAAGWCPMCTAFEPGLLQFRQAVSDSGKPVELIYVGSDRSADDISKRASAMGMLSVPMDDGAEMKEKHRVWAGSETPKFGAGRRSGVPALVVLDGTGEELAFVAAEAGGVKALETWPLDDERGVWGA